MKYFILTGTFSWRSTTFKWSEYEEYAIHDTENFPMEISEYTSIDELNRIYDMIGELPDYIADSLEEFLSGYVTLDM